MAKLPPSGSDAIPGAFGPPRNNPPPKPADINVIRLSHASATDLAKTLSQLFAEQNFKIVADPNTNSLLVHTSPEMLKVLTSVIEKVDMPSDRKRQ